WGYPGLTCSPRSHQNHRMSPRRRPGPSSRHHLTHAGRSSISGWVPACAGVTCGGWKTPFATRNTLPGDIPPEVAPVWIGLCNQPLFPATVPLLQQLFALNGSFDAVMGLKPNQNLAAVLLGETWHERFAMLVDAAHEIVGDADIERAVLAIAHHVNEVHARPPRADCSTSRWLSPRRGP